MLKQIAILSALLALPGYCLPIVHNICSMHIRQAAKIAEVPEHHLYAIGQVEAGRWNKKRRAMEIWPWAVQAQGKSHYFSSKNVALSFIKRLLDQGITNIDVGCMQVNLAAHRGKFTSPADAIDPQKNVQYSAKYLKQLYDTHLTWAKASEFYHSSNSKHQKRYRQKLEQFLKEKQSALHKQGPKFAPPLNVKPMPQASTYKGFHRLPPHLMLPLPEQRKRNKPIYGLRFALPLEETPAKNKLSQPH